jgi:hypothetical protein
VLFGYYRNPASNYNRNSIQQEIIDSGNGTIKGGKVQLTVPHRKLMSLSRVMVKLVLVPMGRAECTAIIYEALTCLQVFVITR